MPATTNVNFRTVVHEKSSGMAMFFPDVCKTPAPPAGPIPIPYPNIAQSTDTDGGSTKVKIDGCPIMLKDSNFKMSSGDEAGSAGGVMSSCTKGKAEFLNYSFDVKIEGKNVPRLGDMMLGNKKNTPPMPEIQPPTVIVDIPEPAENAKEWSLKKMEVEDPEAEDEAVPQGSGGGAAARKGGADGGGGDLSGSGAGTAPKAGAGAGSGDEKKEKEKKPEPTIKAKWSKSAVSPEHFEKWPPKDVSSVDVAADSKVLLEVDTTDVPDGTAGSLEIRHAHTGALIKNGSLKGLKIKGNKLVDPATGNPPEWVFKAEQALWDPWNNPFYFFKANVFFKSLKAETPKDIAASEADLLRLNYWHACLADGHADAALDNPLDTIGDVDAIKKIISGLPNHLVYPQIMVAEKADIKVWGSVFRNSYSYYHSSHGLDDVIYLGKTEIGRSDASNSSKVPSVPKYFIYFDSCLTGVEGAFAGAFIKRGTRNVMAFKQSIFTDEARRTAKEFYTEWCNVHHCDPAKIPDVFALVAPSHVKTMTPVLYGLGGNAPGEGGMSPMAQAAIVIGIIAAGALIGVAAAQLLK